MRDITIEQFMTQSPHTIGHHQTLADAHRTMRKHGIRHLPVLDAGKLVGIVSQRDLHFVETLSGVDPEQVKVSEAMTQDTFAIGRRAAVREVAAQMADHKYGCAVVLEHAHVIGVFTTTDALRALCTLLEPEHPLGAVEAG